MNKIILSLLTVLLINCYPGYAAAWSLWGNEAPLLTINDHNYQIEDYLNWWHEWRESAELPQSADDYINWLLLAGEAEQMQLQDQPSYREKIDTFLKVRSLMMLKKEEVDDKVTMTDDKELHKIYLSDYAPRWQLRTITFAEHEDLNRFFKEYDQSPDSSSEELLDKLELSDGKTVLSSTVWERPRSLPAQILALVQQTKTLRFSAPYPWNNTWQLIELISTQPATDEDFSRLRNNIADQELKKQQGRLTAELMNSLREKYPVTIDDEVLSAITYDGIAEEQGQSTVLELLSYRINAAQLHAAAKRQFDSFAPQQNKEVAFQRTLHQVINGIITQNLTNAEALARNYQLRPPLKSTFDFYCKHRLIRELERQLIVPAAQVSESELKRVYETRKQQMAATPTVELIRAETSDAQLAESLYEKMRHGEEFEKIIALLGYTDPQVESLPSDHMAEPLKLALQQMKNGDCDLVRHEDTFTFVKLIGTKQQQSISFDDVKNAISAQLKQQAMRNKRNQIIQQLRQRSQIKLNQEQWQSCLEQLRKEAA